MFANFELSPSGGLVAADVKPRRIRTDLGCLPCRRKKKKCDLTKPVCLRCRKSIGDAVCDWPTHITASEHDHSPHPPRVRQASDVERHSSSSPSAIDSATETTLVLCHGTAKGAPDTAITAPLSSIERCLTLKLPAGVNKSSPQRSSSQLIQITTAFDRAMISPTNESIDRPASHLCLPLCLENSALMHAWLSCGTAFLENGRKGGLQKAYLHYQHAVKDLATALSGTGFTAPEWKLATILLLHTFEIMDPNTTEPASIKSAHLNGAHHLVRASMMTKPPSSLHELFLLEVYSFRTVSNRLFQPFPSLPYTYIEDLHRVMCLPGSPRRDMYLSWRKCPWAGMSAPLFDICFKLCWLRDKLPLQGINLVNAIALSNEIHTWRPPVEFPEDLFNVDAGTADTFMLENLLAAKVWWYGCMLLCHKLLNPTSSPFDLGIVNPSRQAQKLFQQIALMKSGSALTLLPISLLGTGAVTAQDQESYLLALGQCAIRTGPGSINRTIQFLRQAWALDDMLEAGFLGSDILLRTDILAQYFT